MDRLLLLPIILPILAGALLVAVDFAGQLKKIRKTGKCEGDVCREDAVSESSACQRDAVDESGACHGDAAPGGKACQGDAVDESGACHGDAVSENSAAGLELRLLFGYVGAILAVSVAAVAFVLADTAGEAAGNGAALFSLLDGLPILFRVDGLGRLFAAVTSIVWLASTVYAFVYMKPEKNRERYFGFWLMLYGVLMGIDFSGSLVTMYLFYELMTLVSVPLVLHNGTKEAIMASLKYLFYSLCGAYGGLFGIFFLYRYCDSLVFTPGGALNAAAVQGREGMLLIAVFAMLVGFGAKAGMFPLHAWLPAAHPVAPSPASAVLSAVIVKSGVLAVVRAVFYIVGADFLRGTWVQYGWLAFSLVTVFMGSLLAFREQGFKKRLAYSTVSQVSYILFGLALLTPEAFAGALLHVVVHAFVKCGLFLTAGVFLYRFGYTKVGQLAGMGKRMPGLMWCYTVLSLALVGIPPTAGFISKWHLAEGALQSGAGIFSWLGPVVLLVSALLTAGYLLPVAMRGFFPGAEEAAGQENADGQAEKLSGAGFRAEEAPGQESADRKAEMVSEAGFRAEEAAGQMERMGQACPAGMLLPIAVLAGLALLLGILPNWLLQYAEEIAASVL